MSDFLSTNWLLIPSTGKGEMFMRSVAAYDISARMQYGGLSLKQAVSDAMHRGTTSSTVAPAQVVARGEFSVMLFSWLVCFSNQA